MGRGALTRAAVAGAALAVGCGGGDPPVLEAVPVLARPAGGLAERATGAVLADGRVLTVAHALAGARSFSAGGVRAVLEREDRALDLAVLAPAAVAAATPRDGDAGSGGARPGGVDGDLAVGEARAGDEVRVLVRRGGLTRALGTTVRRRISARLADEPGRPRRPTLELGVGVRAGDSGAPVVDADGRLVGVLYARSTRRARTAYAVHGAPLRAFLAGK